MKIGVLLSGCGVFDGAEIHEATLALLAIAENGGEAVCFAPDKDQLHVINHMTGDEMDEKRNVLIESARIARGDIQPISEISPDSFDALVIPGGFGAAKNLNTWALKGPDSEIDESVKKIILATHKAGKPIAGLCMGPTVIAKALQDSGVKSTLTMGTTEEKSPYDIKGMSEGLETVGAVAEMKTVREIAVDEKNKIVSAPCYLMEATIVDIRNNTKKAIDQLFKWLS